MSASFRFWIYTTLFLLAAILVPFAILEKPLEDWTALMLKADRGAWWKAGGVILVLALDILLPVPSSIVSTAAGYLLVFPAGLAASLAGTTLGYALGYGIGRFTRDSIVSRVVNAGQLDRITRESDRWGDWVVVVFRPVPVLAEASVVVAGLMRRPWGRFLILTTLANLGISAAYSAVGAFALETQSFLLAFAGAVTIPGLAMWAARRRAPR